MDGLEAGPEMRRRLDLWARGEALDEDLRDAAELGWLGADLLSSRAARVAVEPIPGNYGFDHLLAFHGELFKELGESAGKLRDMQSGEASTLTRRFNERQEDATAGMGLEFLLDSLADHLSLVNELRPFETGNGPTIRAFCAQLAAEAGYRLDWHHVSPRRNTKALDAAARGDKRPLRELLVDITSPIDPERVPGEFARDRPPFFNPHEAARSYSGAAGILAGFCFAAIVLLINLQQTAPGRFGSAVGALLTAFLGLVISAFLFALLAGHTRRSARSFWVAHLAGIILATSALFALWGLGDVVAVVFSTSDTALKRDDADLINLVRGVFVVASILVTAFVWVTSVDLRRIAGEGNLVGDSLKLATVAVCTAVATRVLAPPLFHVSQKTSIDTIAYLELLIVLAAVIVALGLSSRGRLHQLRGEGAKRLTFGLVAVPPLFATLLFLRLADNLPPDCTKVSPDVESLGAPDDKPKLVSLTREIDPFNDPGDRIRIAITGVTQDEPIDTPDVRDAAPDAMVGPSSEKVYLRAESSPSGGGRVYHIAFRVTDTSDASSAATCTGTKKVEVLPKNKGDHAVESGPASFDSFGR